MVMKNKRVIIDASPALTFPNRCLDGIGRSTVELIRALEGIDDLPFEIGLFAQRLSSDRLQKYNFKFPVHILPLPRWDGLEWVRSKLPTVEMMTGADLLHVQNYAPVYNPSNTIVTIHDAIFLACPDPHLHSIETTQKIVALAQSCQAVITDSEHSKKDISNLMQIDPDKIHVCYLGYDAVNFYVEPEMDAVRHTLNARFGITFPYFLSVSCDIGRKNSPAVIEQFLKVAAEGGGHHLVMVWRNPPANVLKMVADSPSGNRVRFVADVTDEDLCLLYNGATALLFPSKYEGFGLPVLEAMACGTPVVTCDVSSLPEVGGDAPIYISVGDDEALCNAMRLFEEGGYQRNELVSRCLRQAEKFSWEKCVRKTIEVYTKCLSR